MNKKLDIEKLSNTLLHSFKREELLIRAFTHRSVSSLKESYERLEFLGDRVLGLIIADILLDEYPMEEEGSLARRHTAMVRTETLADIAIECDFGKHIMVSDDKDNMQSNINILADIVEACIGALFRDGGLEAVKPFVIKYFKPRIALDLSPPKDSKTTLQEWSQKNKLGLPKYKMIERRGKDHNPVFVISVNIETYEPVEGTWQSKQEASQNAAMLFIKQNLKEKI